MEFFNQSNTIYLAILAVLMPLISFVWVSTLAKRGSGISILSILCSLILSAIVFTRVWNGQPQHFQVHWFSVGSYHLTAGILLNNLSAGMILLVSGVAFIVHLYSIQYMRSDPYLRRYWRYLSLFCFSMMALVVVDNLLVLYMFWELVGFTSYLLIGFWYKRDYAVQAAKKAFIFNRIGDLGFLAGIMILLNQFGTLNITELFGDGGAISNAMIEDGVWISGTHQMPAVWLTLAGGAFFFGAIAKSAQFPLHAWLPDAMAGPTSVSSLIHAATMVAAGIFLIARIYPIFDQNILMLMVITGSITSFMAATIALVQNDLKQILAFSTISQLGFMMLAMGIGAYDAALFHLTTHAFFKCLLFLCAGAVIHQLEYFKQAAKIEFDCQDIRNMGGLKNYMPITFTAMLFASMALAGLPFTSGYLSKDSILLYSFDWASSQTGLMSLVPYLAVLTSLATTFYIARLIFKVFFGSFRQKQRIPVLEPPSIMKVSLMLLVLFCVFPMFSWNPFSVENSWILKGFSADVQVLSQSRLLHILVPLLVTFVSFALIYLASIVYSKRDGDGSVTQVARDSFIYELFYHQWFINKLYNVIFVIPLMYLSRVSSILDNKIVDGLVNGAGRSVLFLGALSTFVDRYIIDGIVNLLGSISKSIGNVTRHFQSGRVQHYMITMILLLLTFFIFKYFS